MEEKSLLYRLINNPKCHICRLGILALSIAGYIAGFLRIREAYFCSVFLFPIILGILFYGKKGVVILSFIGLGLNTFLLIEIGLPELKWGAFIQGFLIYLIVGFVFATIRDAYSNKENPEAIKQVKICMHCKAIKTPSGDWKKLEEYFSQNSANKITFSHGICEICHRKYYVELETEDVHQPNGKNLSEKLK